MVKPLFDSIAIQQHIDFNDIDIIICNDGTDVWLSDALLNSYPFKITYYKEPHKGVSATRNACLKHATAEYIMFCDADDMFYHFDALHIIFNYMKLGFDLLTPSFKYEVHNNSTGEITYTQVGTSNIFVHGKVYNRQFLTNQNIWWDERLTIHEDCYFNKLCEILAKNIITHEEPYYIWKWRPASVSRENYLFPYLTNTNMMDSFEALVDELLRRGLHGPTAQIVIAVIYEVQHALSCLDTNDEYQKQIYNRTLQRFKTFYVKFKDIWKNSPNTLKAQITYHTRVELADSLIEIDEWLMQVENEELYIE